MSVRHEKLLQYLLDKGIQLPAVYEMEWLEDQKAWVGCCKDLPEPEITAVRQHAKSAAGRRKQ